MSALVYGVRLKAEMTRRSMTVRALQDAAGISESFVCQLRMGRCLPRLAVSESIAEALAAPSLHEYVVEVRSGSCVNCGARFVSDARGIKRFCSRNCSIIEKRADGKPRRRTRYIKAEYRLRMIQDDVDRHCRSCEPSGLCQTPSCDLRRSSPLPLAKERAA